MHAENRRRSVVRAWLHLLATTSYGAVMLIILKILALWIAFSVVTGVAIAPALARRLRNINFPPEDK